MYFRKEYEMSYFKLDYILNLKMIMLAKYFITKNIELQ